MCDCGSKKQAWVEKDGHGIFLCRVCEDCYSVRMARFRGNIKSRYEHREDLE